MQKKNLLQLPYGQELIPSLAISLIIAPMAAILDSCNKTYFRNWDFSGLLVCCSGDLIEMVCEKKIGDTITFDSNATFPGL